MLNIYYGRENINKEKFMYETIRNTGQRAIIIVPDQYTLEAERQAFRYLETESLIDVEIISMSRLGFKLLAELGGSKENFIDKYGRHMVLSRIVKEEEDNIEVFKGALAKGSFVELVNNFISEMKQYEVTPELLQSVMEPTDDTSLLKKKLKDLTLIYGKYEEAIAGKFTDSEDYINLYVDKIPDSKLVKNSVVWVYGFDSFAPKAIKVLQQLMACSLNLNIVLAYDKLCRDQDLFQLTELVMMNLESCAKEIECKCSRVKIDDQYIWENKADSIKSIESELYAIGKKTKRNHNGITIVKAANMYNEAESAASYVLHLIRDKGLRYRDIVVICNDQNTRGSILRRVFNEYGLDYFDDKKRGILNSPIVIFAASLLEAVTFGYRTGDVFKLLKTGFTEFTDDEIEYLENYVIKYRIKGHMWKKTFPKGESEYGTEGIDRINSLRQRVMDIFKPVEELFKSANTVKEFVEGYYDYLSDGLKLPEQIVEFIKIQREMELVDNADETQQIWSLLCGILDQIIQLSGDDPFDKEEFIYIFTAGLDQVEVGVLPSTIDDILVGTMQRTRAGQIKALIVVGANEGLIPSSPSDEDLFTKEEMDFLAENGGGICKSDRIRSLEEQLAIYKNLSKPEEYLWISYSTSDEDGKESRESEIIDQIMRIFPDLRFTKDVLNRETPDDLIGGRVNTLKHLTENMQNGMKGEQISPMWKPVWAWFEEQEPETIDSIRKGFAFTNKQIDLPVAMVGQLFKKEEDKPLSISPSRIERFSRCPFAHFVSYGLRPEERRVFQAAGREIGDVYHSCLMELSEILNDNNSWDTITEEECRDLVSKVVAKNTSSYADGLFNYSNEEKYKTTRIEDAAFYVCWSLIEQVRCGKIKSSQYEVTFGRGRSIKPIEVQVNGETVYIEGKIDRLDILENDRVKIIDYKTGQENFDEKEARGGYRLQLMLYLRAAQENIRKPAAIFYFLIRDPRVDVSGIAQSDYDEKISKEMKKFFKLNGIIVDNGTVIDQIAGDFEGISEIVPLRRKQDGSISGTSSGNLLSEEEFEELQQVVDGKVKELCQQLIDGRIEIKPKKSKDKKPCDFCEFKGICRFDLEFEGCSYDVIQ